MDMNYETRVKSGTRNSVLTPSKDTDMLFKKNEYRKHRQESKKALVNQFNSLSLMENNDFGTILEDLKSSRNKYGED